MDNNCFSERDSRNISIPATIINDDKERRYLPANRRGLTNFDHQLSLGPLVVGQDYAKVDAALIATEKYISVTRRASRTSTLVERPLKLRSDRNKVTRTYRMA